MGSDLKEVSFGESMLMNSLGNVVPHEAGNQQNHPEVMSSLKLPECDLSCPM